MRASSRAIAIALAVAVASCAPAIPEGRLACTDDSQCPDRWVCRADRRCWSAPIEAAAMSGRGAAGERGRAGAGAGESGSTAAAAGRGMGAAGSAGAAGTNDPPPNPSDCEGCTIGDACIEADAPNPDNACERCDPARSTTAWSDRDGETCDDGLFCTEGDACSGSTCSGMARSCSDGVACNGQESCNEDADTCEPGSVNCPDSTLCDTSEDRCVSSCATCIIGQSCIADGATHPTNPCLACDVERSVSDWSNNDGAACGDGDGICTAPDSCMGGVCRPNHDPAGTNCGSGPALCSGQDTCDGKGVCLANDYGTSMPCRPATHPCDATEYCNSNLACPPDSYKPSGTECVADSDPNTIDECNSSGSCVSRGRYCDQYRCWKVPPTGQTRCFDDRGAIACPGTGGAATCGSTMFCGQDAQHPDPSRTFVCKTSAGATKSCGAAAAPQDAVEDSLTGFVWQRDVLSSYGASCGDLPTCQWQQAKQYCDQLVYAGQSDWRLPELRALLSLMNYGKTSPTTDFPGTTIVSDYWTSSEHFWGGNHAHYVDFVEAMPAFDQKTAYMPVRCVRGGSTLPNGGSIRFYAVTAEPEVMVYDRATGVVWQGITKERVDWPQALAYCEGLTYAGKSDWRLPNQQEIFSLVDYDQDRELTTDFPNTLAQDYWSSTTVELTPNHAYVARFIYAHHSQVLKSQNLLNNARCVRNYP